MSSRAEEQKTDVGATLRRPDGFGAAPAPAAPVGFGRRAVPIPSTTNGMAPLTVANDRAARADDSIELSFAAEQNVETHPIASDAASELTSELTRAHRPAAGELRRGRGVQQEAVLCALGARRLPRSRRSAKCW